MPTILTIGHSNYSQDQLLTLLKEKNITQVVDVRSTPFSKFASHFNKPTLQAKLQRENIAYRHDPRLGGRPSKDELYAKDNHRARYDLMAQEPSFAEGMAHLTQTASAASVTALLCTEKDPLQCHRTLLVGHNLALQGVDVNHVLSSNGAVIPHEALMDILIAKFHTTTRSDDRIVQVNLAVTQQARTVAYRNQTAHMDLPTTRRPLPGQHYP